MQCERVVSTSVAGWLVRVGGWCFTGFTRSNRDKLLQLKERRNRTTLVGMICCDALFRFYSERAPLAVSATSKLLLALCVFGCLGVCVCVRYNCPVAVLRVTLTRLVVGST